MKNLLAKIYEIQKELQPIIKSENNPFYKSKYFDVNMVIEHLMPLLTKHGVVVLQPLSNLDGAPAIKTIIADNDNGEMMDDVTPLPKIDDPQKMGSAVTYFRRYALTSLFLVQGEEDDDANATVKPQAKPQAQTPTSAPTTQPSASQSGTHMCKKCSKPFTPKAGTESYAKDCYDCYKKSKAEPVQVVPQVQSDDIALADIPF